MLWQPREGIATYGNTGAPMVSLRPAPTRNSARLTRADQPHPSYTKADQSRPSCQRLNTTLTTQKECKKVINTKKVNISVLIVKITPGQEFVSNSFSPVLVLMWPSQDDLSSLFFQLALDFSGPF